MEINSNFYLQRLFQQGLANIPYISAHFPAKKLNMVSAMLRWRMSDSFSILICNPSDDPG